MSEIWFLLFLVLLIIEIFTVDLVSIWFALAAVIVGFLSLAIDSVVIQTVIFIVLAIVLLVISRPFMKKMKVRKVVPTNLDRVIGRDGVVTREITEDEPGEVKVLSTLWTAIADEELSVGDKVVVEKIEGVKIIVKKKGEK